MDFEKRAEEYFLKGYNCCQAVAASFSDAVGISEETMLKLSCSFGGGFARKRYVCGAVSGMGIVLGLLFATSDSDAKKENYKLTRKLSDKFENEFGSIVCSELLNSSVTHNDSTVPEERTAEYYKKRTCLDCVRCAVRLVAEEIDEQNQ